MIRKGLRFGFVLCVLASTYATRAKADPVIAGTTDLYSTAIMDLRLLPNTPFNGGSDAIVLMGVSGTGTITLNRSTQVGTTIDIPTLAGGMYYGSDPNLGSYVFGNIPPLIGADFSGQITNVVQDTNDPGYASGLPSSFRSGDFSFGGSSFGFKFLSGPAAGVSLFTDPTIPFSFSSTFDGLPPSAGTVLQNSGPDSLDVLFNGQVVAQSFNRTIIVNAVPEPTSFALIGLGAIGMAARHRLRGGKRKV